MSLSISKTRSSTVLIVALAALLRLLLLGLKPPHFDEGVNGWFVDQITKTGFFHYDPTNYHGPLHFYVLFLSQTLFGRNIWALRVPVALVSIATVWLVLRFDRFIGRRASEMAALAMAVSPAAVFYGRYAIHESWLVLFLILSLFGFVGLWRVGTKACLWAFAMGLAGMILTKETYIIHLGCFLLAAGCVRLLEFISPSAGDSAPARQSWTNRDLISCSVAGLGAVFFFYSGTLLDLKSLHGLYQTYAAWAQTGAAGHGHEKPFYYWVKPLMLRYEWVALTGVATSLYVVLPGKSRLMRFIAIFGCGTLVAYSIVRYKTPWCIISLLWPFFFLFGYLFQELLQRYRFLTPCAASLLLVATTARTIHLNFFHYTDENEPYVYVQTTTDISRLTTALAKLNAVDPTSPHLIAHIIVESYHPLPWLLGDYTGVGYYGADRKPQDYDADFLLVEESRREEVETALRENYFVEPLKLRASQDALRLYLNLRRFAPVFPTRLPDFTPSATPAPSTSP